MEKRLLMGNEAIAWGAVEAGVAVAAAYPGTPSSEVVETLAHLAPEYGFHAEWSVNEKVALEVASGAAYTGARALAAMKQVGLNVAADPLMSLAYIGIKGGLVLVVADDPGPHSSQTEQDTRKFAAFAKLPVFDPSSPQEAKEMVKAAFVLSEEFHLPVILRPTTRTAHMAQDVAMETANLPTRDYRFEKDPKWVIFPSLSYKKHILLNQAQKDLAEKFSHSPFNHLVLNPESSEGIVASGVSYNYVMEACETLSIHPSILKIGTPYPLPSQPVLDLFAHCARILVVEEQEPVVEDQLIQMAWKEEAKIEVSGKQDGRVPREGELNVDKVIAIIKAFLRQREPKDLAQPPHARVQSILGTMETTEAASAVEAAHEHSFELPPLPLRTPVLCAGCPHRASFYAFKEVGRRQDAVFTGDIGCYTLGTIPPLDMLDTCLCMGAGVTQAIGMSKVEPGRKHVAFIGDSTFFHSGIPGMINAVYNQADITIVILDNRTTAMTGHQPHPGLERTATGPNPKPIDIQGIVKACGVEFVREVDPYDLKAMKEAAREAMAYKGTAVVIAKRECVALVKPEVKYVVDPKTCTGCELCLKKLGCPAMAKDKTLVVIQDNCSGCGVCAQVCPQNAVREVSLR